MFLVHFFHEFRSPIAFHPGFRWFSQCWDSNTMFWALKPSFWRKPAENARFHSNSCSQTMFSAMAEFKLGFENDPYVGER